MSQPDLHDGKKPRWTLISVALLVTGLLILVPSGLCTVLMGASILVEGTYLGEPRGMILVVLLFGGVPAVVGGVLVWAGFKARPRD